MSKPVGLLSDIDITELITNKQVHSVVEIEPSQIQASSLDLRLGDVAYLVKASFLPSHNKVMDKLDKFAIQKVHLKGGALLEPNAVYIVPLQETLDLPSDISAFANPKSSTGRLDIFTRIITDYAGKFDSVEAGYKGNLYLEISSKTFPVIVHSGSKLSQIRFRKGNVQLIKDSELRNIQCGTGLILNDNANINNGLELSLELIGDGSGLVGYRAKKDTQSIDVENIKGYRKEDFWEPIYASQVKDGLVLETNEFYILSSYEYVCIPNNLAAEMVPFDPLLGEFRAHYAGFFDPGFGMANEGRSRAVLEVRSFDIAFVLEHKQTIGKLLFEPMLRNPSKLYGRNSQSNYQGQGLKLSKHFY